MWGLLLALLIAVVGGSLVAFVVLYLWFCGVEVATWIQKKREARRNES